MIIYKITQIRAENNVLRFFSFFNISIAYWPRTNLAEYLELLWYLIINSFTIFRQMFVVRRLLIKQYQKYLTRQKSSNSKIEDLREKIKMKTPMGNVY